MTATSASGAKASSDPTSLAASETAELPAVRWRWIASGLIIWQLWAVLGEPVEFMTRAPMSIEGSPAGEAFNRPVKAYSEFTYLNHGYAFFAPDPGPSHLIEVRVENPGGEPLKETFPSLQQQWPRLLYHRHFMLTEFLHNLHAARLPAELRDDTSEEIADWRASRQQFEAIRDSFRRHVASTVGVEVQHVSIARIEHRAPFVPEYLLDSVRLRDERLYTELPDEWAPVAVEPLPGLGAPLNPQEIAPGQPSPAGAVRRELPTEPGRS
ncbi:hypothetical protein [Roseimaritima ulvae]|uniref:Uncharacterized protein n=1 Tax=Roseimaritima ulvae TaxID=980254 RepID=A0A5B9R0S1_9BACT|nr:hypothetical protein [Roseimaritima ulvae]QEG43345.1 hypothetical protein UC8_53920 [Roseimaritima ulvae]